MGFVSHLWFLVHGKFIVLVDNARATSPSLLRAKALVRLACCL